MFTHLKSCKSSSSKGIPSHGQHEPTLLSFTMSLPLAGAQSDKEVWRKQAGGRQGRVQGSSDPAQSLCHPRISVSVVVRTRREQTKHNVEETYEQSQERQAGRRVLTALA